MLGGVEIPYAKGLEGHSDADVLLHAITDALLGAAALGDIGKHFPNTDPRFKNISSLLLLEEVAALLARRRISVVNLDSTLVLEEPKISPYIDDMRRTISDALGVSIDRVSVKATTQEGMGAIGRGEGVCAHAVATVLVPG